MGAGVAGLAGSGAAGFAAAGAGGTTALAGGGVTAAVVVGGVTAAGLGAAGAAAGAAGGGVTFAIVVGAGTVGFAAAGAGGATGFWAVTVGAAGGGVTGFAAAGTGAAGLAACGAGAAGLAAAGGTAGFTGSTLMGAAGLFSSGGTARATCTGALVMGVTPGGGRRRTTCGRAMAGATPGGGRSTTRPLDPPPVMAPGAPGAVGTSNRRPLPRVPSRADRSIETEPSVRTVDLAGLPVATPSARAGATPKSNAAAVSAIGDHRLDDRRSFAFPVAAYLMRLTFRPPHILRWPARRCCCARRFRPKPLKSRRFGLYPRGQTYNSPFGRDN